MRKKNLNQLSRPTLILIGGVPGVGKSTVAVELAQQLGITEVIGTDTVREVLRCTNSKNKKPFLFEVTHCAWKLVGHKNKTNIIKGYQRHVFSITPPLMKTVTNFLAQGKDVIVEGAHVPLIETKAIKKKLANVVRILLVLNSPEFHIRRLKKKHLERHGRRKRRWTDHFDEFLILQAYNRQYSAADLIIDNTDKEKTIRRIISFLNNKLK